MICVVILGPNFDEARQQIKQAIPLADLVELRLDRFFTLDLNLLKKLRSDFSIPMIFTLKGMEENVIYSLLELQPEYLDLETPISDGLLQKMASDYPKTKLIHSYHNFSETPEDLDSIYQKMQIIPAFYYKIAVMAQNSVDALRLIYWAKKYPNLIAMSMGSYGQVSRILGPTFGSPITYAALDEAHLSAPGQLTAETLIHRYHYRKLHRKTALYGLIGDPIEQSISDVTHNHLIRECSQDAIYIKMQVSALELPKFLPLAQKLSFRGLSVTMPLKEAILPFLDVQASFAVNTLLFQDGKILGYNTDGVGALDAIERHIAVKDKHMIILGAGGAAKAIAYEAHRRDAKVIILNRDARKALSLAGDLGCMGHGLDYMATCAEKGYDILINCTSSLKPIDDTLLLPEAYVMDITTKPKETLFLQQAKKKGCQIIYGYEMFVEQALGQFHLWFACPNKLNRTILEEKSLLCLR